MEIQRIKEKNSLHTFKDSIKIINIGSNLCVQFKKIPMNINSMCGYVSEKKNASTNSIIY